MFVHQVRPFTLEEAADFAPYLCWFPHADEPEPPAATHRVFGTDMGHVVGSVCCRGCAAEMRADITRRRASRRRTGCVKDMTLLLALLAGLFVAWTSFQATRVFEGTAAVLSR